MTPTKFRITIHLIEDGPDHYSVYCPQMSYAGPSMSLAGALVRMQELTLEYKGIYESS